jgi:hypothetical protein
MSSRPVEAYQCSAKAEFTARLTESINDEGGDDVGGRHCLLALRHMPHDDAIKAKMLPQPARQPDVSEASGVAPADVADADDLGIVGESDILIIGKKP